MVEMTRSMRGRAKKWTSIAVESQVILLQVLCSFSHLYMHSRHEYVPPRLLVRHWLRVTCIEYNCT